MYCNLIVEEKVVIKNARLEFITTKTDKYDNETCYFKLKHKNVEQKFGAIIKDGFKLPWFKSDKGQNILKVKTKYNKLKDTIKDEFVVVDICFKYYKMDDMQGFYVSQLG